MAEKKEWIVQPHGKLERLADNLWTVEGTIRMPPGPLSRRMTVARLQDGGLVIFSAISLEEAEMQRLEALGEPSHMIVPNAFHRLDAAAWKARYPRLRVVAPPGARSAVEQVVPVDDSDGIFPDETVRFFAVPGTRDAESALLVASRGETTLVINDLIGNVRDASGLMKFVLSAMGFAGREPQIPRAFKAQAIKDKRAVAEQFRRWAQIPDLKRIVVSHGSPIEDDAAGVLRRLAGKLS